MSSNEKKIVQGVKRTCRRRRQKIGVSRHNWATEQCKRKASARGCRQGCMQQANGVQQGKAGRGRCAGGAVGINLAFVNSKGVDASLGRGFSACRGNPPATNQTNKHEMGNAKKGL